MKSDKGRLFKILSPKNGGRLVAEKIGRNEPCKCGSGLKAKKCNCGVELKTYLSFKN